MEHVIVRKSTMKQMLKVEAAKKKMTVTEVARASGRDQSTVSNMASKGSVNTRVLSELLEAMGEKLILLMSDGTAHEIVIE